MKALERLSEMSEHMWLIYEELLPTLLASIKEIVATYPGGMPGWEVRIEIYHTDGVIMTDLEFSDEFYVNEESGMVAEAITEAVESVSPILDGMVGYDVINADTAGINLKEIGR